LATLYKDTIGDVNPEDVIVHCGSGVTACHTLLGMEHAGITGPKLYVGSWSEWSRSDLPIATELTDYNCFNLLLCQPAIWPFNLTKTAVPTIISYLLHYRENIRFKV
jgi:hypothetical protein